MTVRSVILRTGSLRADLQAAMLQILWSACYTMPRQAYSQSCAWAAVGDCPAVQCSFGVHACMCTFMCNNVTAWAGQQDRHAAMMWSGAVGSTGICGMRPGSLAAHILKVAFAAQASNA